MKKFLSLVLALVMTMSLVTISSSAKDFTDDETITYDEAVAVISEIGVVDGYTDGSFKPTNTLTRQAAAKIICNLILGPTTASELSADAAPYSDVPVTSEFAGYIAYCQKEGIISGYADGTFKPGNSLTGYAFLKMLLGALGYNQYTEGYTGDNWSINVAKQAIGIGLNNGLADTFNGVKAVTREEACLYAFNTLQADLVEYTTLVNATINGTPVTVGSSTAQAKTWGTSATRINNIKADEYIQFAEQYFNKLEKKKTTDDFERPAYTWIYDKQEIGTYVDYSLLVGSYTTGVTGRELYDLLGSSTIRDNDLAYYVDGVVADSTCPVPGVGSADNITKSLLTRSNQDDLGISDNGVLTEVFLDKDEELITITSIDTWLAKATGDYSESKEYAPINVYYGYDASKNTLAAGRNVDVNDVPAIADVQEDDYLLVTISYKSNNNGDVITVAEPEVMGQSKVTKFSNSTSVVASKLTTDGTEYKNAHRAYYSDDALNLYDNSLLTDKTYNIYMDQYGYFIGVELYEGAKNYVFITGFDRPTSNLSISTATAAAIFLDGTMDTIKVNVTATNKNITKANDEYYIEWTNDDLPGNDGSYRLNRWFTYSVNESGVYTLKPVDMIIRDYAAGEEVTIKTDSLYVDDNVMVTDDVIYKLTDSALGTYTSTLGERAYANDNTVFLTVDLDNTDTSDGTHAITDVNGVYTGVQSVEVEISNDNDAEEAEIYVAYDKNHYIVGAVTVGEAKGSNATVAYVLGSAKSEELKDGIYYWEFDAVINGEIKTLTAKSKYTDIFDVLKEESVTLGKNGVSELTKAYSNGYSANLADGLVELRFDADNYVVAVKAVAEKDIYNNYGVKGTDTGKNGEGNTLALNKATAYRIGVLNDVNLDAAGFTVSSGSYTDSDGSTTLYYDSTANQLTLVGRTLYVTDDQSDEGLALASNAKAIVIQYENGKLKKTEWSSVSTALTHLADADPTTTDLEYNGEIVAVLNTAGAADWVVFNNYSTLTTGTSNSGSGSMTLSSITASVTTAQDTNDGPDEIAYTLKGTNSGEKYTIEVQAYSSYTQTWATVETFTKVGTATTTADSEQIDLQPGQYRLVCGSKVSNVFSITL
jgi:hypothetical protein